MTTDTQITSPFTITRLGAISLGIGVATVVADQLSKAFVLYGLNLPERFFVPVIPGVLRFTMVWNPGVSFGMLRASTMMGRVMLIVFALAVVAALIHWARRSTQPLTATALGLVMGGAFGNNVIDRIRFGQVVDFIDVQQALPFFPWVFNVADSAISIGVVLLLIDTLRSAKPAET